MQIEEEPNYLVIALARYDTDIMHPKTGFGDAANRFRRGVLLLGNPCSEVFDRLQFVAVDQLKAGALRPCCHVAHGFQALWHGGVVLRRHSRSFSKSLVDQML